MPDPKAIADAIAAHFSNAEAQKGQPRAPAPVAEPAAAPQANPHLYQMQMVAEAAKQKYMQENGVDENGEPVTQ